MTNQTITFVGGGQMAAALIKGLLRSGWDAGRISVLEPNDSQRERIGAELGVHGMSAITERLDPASAVVWAVKPQVLQTAILPILAHVRDALHLSVVAGIATSTLASWLGSNRIIRAMPNTPAIVGAGVTGMLALPATSTADRLLAEAVFGAAGYCFWVESDERIDAVTAISGSGPGYVFEFMAGFQRAAESIGFPEAQARELVVRTALGALQQAASDTTALSTLRDRVASPGGTTEAGLLALTEHQLPLAIQRAAANAYERAQQLSRQQRSET